MNRKETRNLVVVSTIVLVGCIARLIPHIPNFAPMESLALLSGVYISWRYLAYLTPLVIMFVTDFVLNNTLYRTMYTDVEGLVWFSDYMVFTMISLVLIIFLASKFVKRVSAISTVVAATGSVLVFYLITNLGTWLSVGSLYPKNIIGLMQSYTAAWPFLASSLISNLVFSAVAFFIIEKVTNYLDARDGVQAKTHA